MANELAIHRVSKVDINVRQIPYTDNGPPKFTVTELVVHFRDDQERESTFEVKLFGTWEGIPFGQIGQAIAEKAKEVPSE